MASTDLTRPHGSTGARRASQVDGRASATFDQVFDLYRASGFLYPGKLAELSPRLPTIERTWRRLLAADPHAFRFVGRFSDAGLTLEHAICAFEYASGTWQGQHLVSRHRHRHAGTLDVLMRLVEGFHHSGVRYARLSFRPTNPGTNHLFGDVARTLPSRLTDLSTVDYGLASLGELQLGAKRPVHVRSLDASEGERARTFYADWLSPVELEALNLEDLCFEGLDARYGVHRLSRRRVVLVASVGGRDLGACLVHHASEGVNFSFLENAIEHLYVTRDLTAPQRAGVWQALLCAAVAEVGSSRDYVVAVLDPADRALGISAGLLTPEPKQYAVLTVDRRDSGFLRSIECFDTYYRALQPTPGER